MLLSAERPAHRPLLQNPKEEKLLKGSHRNFLFVCDSHLNRAKGLKT